MAQLSDDNRQRLVDKIKEWNDHRWDLFELSIPNEELEFHGVMRFYFQDPQDQQQTTTKCIRVSSTASVHDVVTILIEKFRPDMRLLGSSNYTLYEVHGNGDERKLMDNERPLLIQLNWNEEARDGRFLLKNEDERTGNMTSMVEDVPPGGFKRKLSKREKKEKKKKEKEAKLKGKENETPNKGSVAEKLYNELPETSFTRSISNPEAVMRRRRQQKLEKKLQQFKSRDGGPDSGGTLKIYGEQLRPDVPYKTLLLSVADTTLYVVKETLEKYSMEKEDPNNYCLVQRVLGLDNEYHGGKEYVLDDDDCPLAILMNHPPSKGTVMFYLRRRTADMPKRRKKKNKLGQDELYGPFSGHMNRNALPYLLELTPDGLEPPQAKKLLLPLNVTEVGSQRSMSGSGQYLLLYAPDIFPRHCVIAHTEGIVTVTPTSKDADTYVEGQRIHDTTLLQHGMMVRFGKTSNFRFLDPQFEEKLAGRDGMPVQGGRDGMPVQGGRDGMPVQGGPPPYEQKPDPRTMETSFDVDGHVETVANADHFQKMAYLGSEYDHKQPDVLPAILEFREDAEPAFLAAVVTEVNGGAVQFKLAPTYTLYMAARYRLSNLYRPDMPPPERHHRLGAFLNQTASMVQHTIQENRDNAGALSFWMANASELLHFVKQDVGLGSPGLDAQDFLAEAVQVAFRYLVHCMQLELRNTMVAFLDDADHDLDDDGDVLQVLSSAMSLLRRCRVNAALTIQLFSQLFHYINMWLFNKLVLEPRLGLCTRVWGHRLKRRLGRVEIWAEKQGLELAADCHLARIIQAAHLLQAPKSSPDDIASISSTCFKLNSLQLHALLSHYIPGPSEPRIPHDLIDSVVTVAKNTADELTRSDGREVRLEEEPDLQLPFLLPEDGYSCDIVRGVPNGLAEFLDPLIHNGICRLSIQQQASGLWTVHMTSEDQENLRGMQPPPGGSGDHQRPELKEPEVIHVTFDKVNGSMGLSIVAAKGEGQEKRGIYIKSVVPGGAAALDGRLRPGDQLLEVDGKSLIGLTQEKAAELMTRTGHTVQLMVGKQGAIYHGLGALLNTPSPVLPRGSPRRSQGAGGKGLNRPKSEEVSRQNGPQEAGGMYGGPPHGGLGYDPIQRPLQQQMGARSSPALSGARSHEQLRDPMEGYGGGPYPRPGVPQSQSYHELARQPYPGDPPHTTRSKSTSNLDTNDNIYPDPRQMASSTTLPGRPGPQQQPQRALDRPGSQPELHRQSERPDLRWVGSDYDRDYENYPGPQAPGYSAGPRSAYPGAPPQPHQPNYVNHQQIREYSQYGGSGDPRNAISTPNLNQEDFNKTLPDHRSKSEELDHSRVAEWQKQNELDRWGQRGPPPPAGYTAQPPHSPYTDDPRTHPPHSYPNTSMRNRGEATPPFEANRRHGEPEPRPPLKPSTPNKAQPDGRFDPRLVASTQQQQQQQQQAYPASSQYPGGGQYAPFSPPHQGMPPHTSQYNVMSSSAETRTVYSHSKPGLATRPDHLPPPPQGPPPGGHPEWLPPGDDLPPPPPPPPAGLELEQQVREEEERMMRRMAGLDPYRDQGRDPRFVSSQQPPEPQRPSPPGGYSMQPPGPRAGPQHPYQPKHDDHPTTPISRDSSANMAAKRPPIAAKPKVLPKPNAANPPSPWERAEKERLEKMKAEEMMSLRDKEIAELEGKPYLSPDEQERLRRLRLDQEFDRRVREANKGEDDEDEADSDTDITDRPSGRAVLFRRMQEDLEKKRQQIVEGRIQRDRDAENAEREKLERQERRLQQFEQEREEQKQRQMKRQEKQEREAEAYLSRQRELRERQRREQEEQAHRLRQEEEQRREKEREDLRRKREMEKEQMREMSLRDEDQYSYEYRAQPAPPSMVPPPQPGYPPPVPPDRHSSYNITGHHNIRNSLGGYEAQTPPRSSSSSALRPPIDLTPSGGKKTVSFDSNLTVEINENQIPYGSTSSEASLYADDGQNHYRSTSSSTSEPPPGPSPFERPNYGPSRPPTNDNVFEQRTPTNQGIPATLVAGPTPGVVGAQEVYRDPRDRIAAQKAASSMGRAPGPERMSFRDKMSMFAREAGEDHTPKDRQKASRAQRVMETDLNGQSVA